MTPLLLMATRGSVLPVSIDDRAVDGLWDSAPSYMPEDHTGHAFRRKATQIRRETGK